MKLKIEITPDASEQFKDMLSKTVWGIEGKTRYAHKDTLKNLKNLVNSTFIYLKKSDRLLGGINLNRRDFDTDKSTINGMYIRYFTFLQYYQSKKTGAKTGKSNGLIKSQIKDIFENGKMGNEKLDYFYYAYVELENERSARVCRDFGFIPLRQLSTTIFTRFFPDKHQNIRLIDDSEKEAIRKQLKDFYSDHYMYHDQQLFHRGNYYVYVENGKTVAGLQANPTHWEIMELPGVSGTIIMKIIPRIPILSRVFNPKNHRFLSFDQVFYLPGHENKLEKLMETALAEEKFYNGMIWTDTKSKLNGAIRSYVNPGIMNKLKNDVPGNIIGKSSGKDNRLLTLLSEKPAYICSFDLT